MAAPLAAFVQLPSDSGNTGKKIRTQTRVVGADTVHEHYFVRTPAAQILGVYRVAMAQSTVLAAAQNGTTTGFLWAHVPVAITGKKVRVRRFYTTAQHSTVLATPTAPRLRFDRFTFTGTASGAQLTAAKISNTYPAPIFDLRTAMTGLVVTLNGSLGTAAMCGALTAVGAYVAAEINIFDPASEEETWVTFAPGEGGVLYQDTAGTSSDTRKFNPCMLFDEIDTA